MNTYDRMNSLYFDLLSTTGTEPTGFLLGARRFAEFKADVYACRSYDESESRYTYKGLPVSAVIWDMEFVGITITPDLAIAYYSKDELDPHPNGKSGAW